jgi:sugar lactone lactonase YvrE
MRGTAIKFCACAALAIAQLTFVCAAFAQHRGLPANVPPNPNWVVSKWGEAPAGMDWQTLKSVDSVNYDPNGKGTIVVLVTPPDPSYPAVWVFDYNGKLQKQWGANMFTRPYDLVVDRSGYLWIVDEMQNLVTKFTEDGKPLMTLGKKGVAGDNASHDSFNGPTGVAIAKNGDIFVSDGYNNSRVVKFDKNGKFLSIIGGTKGSEIGQFSLPHRVVIDSKGELVVMDRVNKRIQFWTQSGKFIKQWTDLGFMYPSGLAIEPDDTFYFSDSDGQSIKIVKNDKILDAIGGLDGMRPHTITVDRFGALYISDEPDRLVKKIVRKSSVSSQLSTRP